MLLHAVCEARGDLPVRPSLGGPSTITVARSVCSPYQPGSMLDHVCYCRRLDLSGWERPPRRLLGVIGALLIAYHGKSSADVWLWKL